MKDNMLTLLGSRILRKQLLDTNVSAYGLITVRRRALDKLSLKRRRIV